jgi:hypothetical protein
MFVTSTMKAPQAFGGLMGADQWCSDAAKAGHLPQVTYRAWLSTANPAMDAVVRLGNSRGWVRSDGKPFVDAVTDLTAGKILYPPRLDEMRNELTTSTTVVTATDGDGTRTGLTCGDYTMANGDSPSIGVAEYGTEKWTHTADVTSCTQPVHIYCFGVGLQIGVTPPPPGGLRAFLSTGTFTPDPTFGAVAADNLCQQEAQSAGLGQRFLALLATDTDNAVHRVQSNGPWTRVDGVEIGSLADPTGTTPIPPQAAINVTVGNDYTLDDVWTGAPDVTSTGSATSTCGNWTSTTPASSIYGDSAASNDSFFFGANDACSGAKHVYCLEH